MNWIKTKLKNAWNWTKRNVKKVVIGLGIIGVALAAGIPQVIPDKSFENLPNVAKEQGLYRVTFDKYSDVEIPENETPEVKLKKWGDETYIKVKYSDFDKKVKPKQEDKKLKWKGKDMEVYMYPLEPREFEENGQIVQQLEQGGFEFEIILKEKPATNKMVLNIETKGLNFYYQPELTQEEKDMGAFRPENVVGSYAVYHESKQGNYEAFPNGKNYMAGKAFHIYRPQMEDANGWKVWGELHYDEQAGTLTTTIPQDFIDNAVYPIRHAAGDTFGYTDIGGSWSAAVYNIRSYFTNGNPGQNGIADDIRVYSSKTGADTNMKGALWKASDLTLVANSVTPIKTINSTTPQWWVMTYTENNPIVSNQDYYVGFMPEGWTIQRIYYDSADLGGDDDGSTYASPGDLTDPLETTTYRPSIYCTYTPAEEEERRIIIIE